MTPKHRAGAAFEGAADRLGGWRKQQEALLNAEQRKEYSRMQSLQNAQLRQHEEKFQERLHELVEEEKRRLLRDRPERALRLPVEEAVFGAPRRRGGRGARGGFEEGVISGARGVSGKKEGAPLVAGSGRVVFLGGDGVGGVDHQVGNAAAHDERRAGFVGRRDVKVDAGYVFDADGFQLINGVMQHGAKLAGGAPANQFDLDAFGQRLFCRC